MKQPDSFPLFDWLRFGLASTVVLVHQGAILWEPAGNLSVQIFFALSGWLIGGIVLRAKFQDLPRFYYNRATRIWIPYFVGVFAIYALSAAIEPFTTNTILFLLHDVTFTHNWFTAKTAAVAGLMPLKGTGAHFWSISVEEQFYLAAPILILALPAGRSVAGWSAIAVVAVLSRSWYGAVSLGVLAAVARSHYGDWHLKRKALVALAAIGTFITLAAVPKTYDYLAPIFSLCVVLIAARQGPRSAIGSFLGGVSYPLYLNHWIGLFAAHWLASRFSTPLPDLVAYVLAVGVGIAAFLMIDRNIMQMRTEYYKTKTGTILMFVAYGLLFTGVIVGLSWPIR